MENEPDPIGPGDSAEKDPKGGPNCLKTRRNIGQGIEIISLLFSSSVLDNWVGTTY